ncbi:MAG: hypothetical protein PHT07_21130 [Paludibacter sp.]|nr:hypothetical protein [Paludibacter sp.]
MKIITLYLAVYFLASFGIVGTFCLIRIYLDNLRLEKENELLKERIEKYEVSELSRKLENDEVLVRMFEDLEREELIFMNT